jgi:mRNA-degrading endonuclease RelE of RelBE toxin-antitoxin system
MGARIRAERLAASGTQPVGVQAFARSQISRAGTIRAAIEQRPVVDPISYGKPLRYALRGNRRLRVGDWRIVYRVEMSPRVVFIVAIDDCKDVYED